METNYTYSNLQFDCEMNFAALEKDLENAIAADQKYERENSAKFRAVEQKVATYDEFRDIVKASHLIPLEKKEKLLDPSTTEKANVIWNVIADKNNENFSHSSGKKQKKHFTEM